ncbi:MAG TPA: hypothetical protein VKZ78_02470 [Sphingobacteriaceae bacterium]|nr:hypothetical protein [Sphingobacteriaceae bacterium]
MLRKTDARRYKVIILMFGFFFLLVGQTPVSDSENHVVNSENILSYSSTSHEIIEIDPTLPTIRLLGW